MPTYTVHAPPPRRGESAEPERFVFVRDGFHFWAFLLSPFWMLARRLWLVFVLYLLFSIALGLVLKLTHVGPAVSLLAGLAVALLLGFEAATLRRWTLARRGWTMLGFAIGEDKEAAERRFYGEWVKRGGWRPSPAPPAPPSAPSYTPPQLRQPPTGVIGLFPEPGNAP
jgi:Protein of unknown function (DUF2628)